MYCFVIYITAPQMAGIPTSTVAGKVKITNRLLLQVSLQPTYMNTITIGILRRRIGCSVDKKIL